MKASTSKLEPSSSQIQTDFHKTLLLKELKKKRTPLLLDLGNEIQCVSVILELDPTAGWCEFDELSSQVEHERLLNCREFVASARLSGVPLSFTSRVVGLSKHEGLCRYRVSIPAEINYFDKRSTHRIHIPLMGAPDAELNLLNNTFRGKLRDISQQGAAIEIENQSGELSDAIQKERITKCTLQDRSGDDITVKAQVRRIAAIAKPKSRRTRDRQEPKITRLGLQFEHLDRSATARLRAYTAALERQQARFY